MSGELLGNSPDQPQLSDLAKFNCTTLAVAHNVDKTEFFGRSNEFDKVLVTSRSSSVALGGCTMFSLVNGGKLLACPPFNKDDKVVEIPWIEISCYKGCVFHDLIICRGMVCALDSKGIDYKSGKPHVGKILVYSSLPLTALYSPWKKHLVVSSDGNLHMVVRIDARSIYVYKVSLHSKWTRVGRIGGQALFLARDYCFFTESTVFPHCKLGNCIVFSGDAFPRCSKHSWECRGDFTRIWCIDRKSAADFAIFTLSGKTLYWDGQSPRFPKMKWSPPSWFLHSASPTHCQSENETQSNSNSDTESQQESRDYKTEKMQSNSNSPDDETLDTENDKMEDDIVNQGDEHVKIHSDLEGDNHKVQFDPDGQNGVRLQNEVVSPITEREEQTIKMISTLTTPRAIKRCLPVNGIKDAANEASHLRVYRKKIRSSVSRDYIASVDESKRDDTIVIFEGLHVKSSLIQILQTIWSKQGNILENCMIRNVDVIGVALESLVSMVTILEGTSIQSLSDLQANYLSDTLSDMRCMGFKVHWLVPFVEKAIVLHQNKQQVDLLNKLGQMKAQTVERREKIHEEVVKVEELLQGLEQDMTDPSKTLPFSEKIDLEQPVGAGLS